MVDSGIKLPTPQDIYSGLNIPLRPVPKPEDIYNVPVDLLNFLIEITPKVEASGAWWSLAGTLSAEHFGRPRSPDRDRDPNGRSGSWKDHEGALRLQPTSSGVKEVEA